MLRLDVSPNVLDWVVDRANISADAQSKLFETYRKWRERDALPTLKQLQAFAKATHVPFGWFLQQELPSMDLAIPDFRTFSNREIVKPSLNLVAIVDLCLDRQDWFRDYAVRQGYEPVSLVGSVRIESPVEEVAAKLRNLLDFSLQSRAQFADKQAALKFLIARVEDLGVLVMVSGIVGNNTHRSLDPEEFRGFALADPMAPVIFINGTDSKSAQMFTLLHELGHLLLGESGVSDQDRSLSSKNDHELWCNALAAEFFVPKESLVGMSLSDFSPEGLKAQADFFKVSTLVLIKQLHSIGFLAWDEYRDLYAREVEKARENLPANKQAGGNFYRTQLNRLSRMFILAVATDAREGNTPYREALALLGTAKLETFNRLAESAGTR